MPTEKKKGSWFSRGKLLLTGEYMVLHGATALALPLRYGQGLEWNGYRSRGGADHAGRTLEWSTFVREKEWLKAVFGITADGYVLKSSSHEERSGFLLEVLNAAAGLADTSLPAGKAESSVGFDMGWGFGSSSTLISNIAWMFDINPFALHFAVSRGSGYDIACARSDKPITYRLKYGRDPWAEAADKARGKKPGDTRDRAPDEDRGWEPVAAGGREPDEGRSREPDEAMGHEPGEPGKSAGSEFPLPVYSSVVFNPSFAGCLYFAYTGRKQDSARSVASFLSHPGRQDAPPDATDQGAPPDATGQGTTPGATGRGAPPRDPSEAASNTQYRQEAFSAPAGITGIVSRVTDITSRVLEADNVDVFTDLLREHDRVIAPLVAEVHPQESQFRGFPGYVKPLGAWGGDFVMIVWKEGRDKLKEALKQKGVDTIFSWDELIVSANGKK